VKRGIYLQLPIKRPYLQNCCTADTVMLNVII
jgi:hypothetical protein